MQGGLSHAPPPASIAALRIHLHPFVLGRKLSDIEKALLWNLLHEDPECPSRALLDQVAQMQTPIAVSVAISIGCGQWQRNRRKGRPRHTVCSTATPGGARVQITPHLSCVGVHLFAHWLDQQDAFGPVVARLQQAIEAHKQAHPADDFALLHHRDQTLRRRFEALFFAPLFGIEPSPRLIPTSIRSRRCLAGAITAPR